MFFYVSDPLRSLSSQSLRGLPPESPSSGVALQSRPPESPSRVPGGSGKSGPGRRHVFGWDVACHSRRVPGASSRRAGILRRWCATRANFSRDVPRLIDGKASGVGLASCSCIVFFGKILLKLVAKNSLPLSRCPKASCDASETSSGNHKILNVWPGRKEVLR